MKISIIYIFSACSVSAANRSFLLLLFLLTGLFIRAQESRTSNSFQAEVVIGANFSQLDGDGLSGFDKLGLRAGFDMRYDLDKLKGVSLSLLYDQRGSRRQMFATGNRNEHISLDYMAFPISIYFNKWWYAPLNRYKIRLYGSIIPARLLSTGSSITRFDNATDAFKKWDISLSAGVVYGLGERSSARLFIERSLLKIYHVPSLDASGLQSYLISFNYSYLLNQ